MKKILVAIALFSCFQQAGAQTDTTVLYKRFPAIPIFNIMTAPDSLSFSKEQLKKKEPTVIMIFSPDCSHCQVATRDLLDHIDLFKKAQVVMVSSADFISIKKFYEEYKIADYPNITLGRDAAYLLGIFYRLKHYPSVFVYNKKGRFIKAFEGTFKMEDVAEEL